MSRASLPFVPAAVAAALLVVSAFATPTAEAQTAPFTAYGSGLVAGDVVKGVIDGEVCGKAIADADGNWVLQVRADAPCSPQTGDALVFWLNGVETSKSETWQPGGAPSDVANGVELAGEGGTKPASTGTKFDWVLPKHGIGLVVCPGGTIEDALASAPGAQSFWVTVDGKLKGYIAGSPDFVNAAFKALYEGGVIPGGTAMVVVIP